MHILGACQADLCSLPIAVVDEQTAEQLRQAIERDESSEADHFAKVKRDAELAQVHAQATNAARLANQIKTDHAAADKKAAKAEVEHTKELAHQVAEEAANEAKHFVADAKAHGSEIYAEGKELAGKAEKKGEQLAGEAKSKGKELAGEAKGKASEYEKKGEKVLSAAENKAKEYERKAEAEARELKKKADKAARAAARELRSHPFATSGVVGAVNLALVAGTGYFAYANWQKPHWDRRIIGAITSAWAVVAGLQVAGYEEIFAK